jgi:hypothetical protein
VAFPLAAEPEQSDAAATVLERQLLEERRQELLKIPEDKRGYADRQILHSEGIVKVGAFPKGDSPDLTYDQIAPQVGQLVDLATMRGKVIILQVVDDTTLLVADMMPKEKPQIYFVEDLDLSQILVISPSGKIISRNVRKEDVGGRVILSRTFVCSGMKNTPGGDAWVLRDPDRVANDPVYMPLKESMKYRVWSDTSGKFACIARLGSVEKEIVNLVGKEGRKISLSMVKLSGTDKKWVRDQLKNDKSLLTSKMTDADRKWVRDRLRKAGSSQEEIDNLSDEQLRDIRDELKRAYKLESRFR